MSITTSHLTISTFSPFLKRGLTLLLKTMKLQLKVINYFGARLFGKKRGRRCYIRHNIKAPVIKDLSFVSDTSFHQHWIQLQYNNNKSVVICVVYRVPNCPLNCFDSLLKPNYTRALLEQKPIIILGDLNCNEMNKEI